MVEGSSAISNPCGGGFSWLYPEPSSLYFCTIWVLVFTANPHVYSVWSFVIVCITFAGHALKDIVGEKTWYTCLSPHSAARFDPQLCHPVASRRQFSPRGCGWCLHRGLHGEEGDFFPAASVHPRVTPV